MEIEMNISGPRTLVESPNDEFYTLKVVSGDKISIVRFAATGEFLTENNKEDWLRETQEKWKKVGEEIFQEPVCYDPYATTSEATSKLLEIMKTRAYMI